jgi:hypothetical protein
MVKLIGPEARTLPTRLLDETSYCLSCTSISPNAYYSGVDFDDAETGFKEEGKSKEKVPIPFLMSI